MKQIIVPTGYMGSGSSAVTDLLKEYPNLNTRSSDFEYIFLHAPNGVFDLENKLLNNNNAVRSDEAIKEFRKFMYRLNEYQGWWPAGYKYTVSENFISIVDQYVDSIVQYKFRGSWYIYEKPTKIEWIKNALLNRLLSLIGMSKKQKFVKNTQLEFSLMSAEEFYKKTTVFIEKIVNEISPKEDRVVLDQLLLPYNLKRIKNYNSVDFKPILITRDPRDVFIANKYVWYPKGENVPYPLDVVEFCRYYKALRQYEDNTEELKFLKIRFEDLVLNYHDTVGILEDFLNLSPEEHKDKKMYFDPSRSINNLKIFQRNTEWEEKISIIEKELKEYLYSFPEKIKFTSDKIF